MPILLSGLDTETSRPFLSAWPTENPPQWLAPADFVFAAQAADPAAPAGCWIWLYRAPWTLLLTAFSAETLAEWQACQRAALQLRRTLGQQLILVNVDRVSPTVLGDALGLMDPQPDPQTASPSAPVDTFLSDEEGLELVDILAKLFEWSAPQYWDIFEALEIAAWLPEGEPLFRHALSPPPATGLSVLGQMLRDGQSLPSVQDQLAERETTISALHKEAKEREIARQALQAAHDRLQQEHAQLQQAQQAAAAQVAAHRQQLEQLAKEKAAREQTAQQLDGELRKTRQALTEAQTARGQLQQEHAQLQQAQQTAAAQANEQRNQLKQENELLFLQLHQVQEELEKIFLESRERAASFEQEKAAQTEKLEQMDGELGQTRQALTEVQAARDQLQQNLEQLQQAQQVAAAQADKQQKQLKQEYECLLTELHKVQDEYESCVLANRALVATMHLSQGTLNHARAVISRISLN